jgi:2'-5' RNA ligase
MAGDAHNLFLALWPDAAVRERLAHAARVAIGANGLRGRRVDPARYHLTLHFLGRHDGLPQDVVARARAAADEVSAAAFTWRIDRVGCFRAARAPLWLGCSQLPDALRALHAALAAALRRHGCVPARDGPLLPHVTILRDARPPCTAVLESPVGWVVDEFVLIDSVVGTAAPYAVLSRWPLDYGVGAT